MKSFEKTYLGNLSIPQGVISQIASLAEFKGKEKLYERQSPETLEALRNVAMIESAESSNRIEGIFVPHERVEALIKKSAPKNRPEEEVAGYRDALNRIHEMHDAIPLSTNVILMFHSLLYKYTNVKSGEWKKGDNEIVEILSDGTKRIRFKPISAFQTPQYMEKLIDLYNFSVTQERTEPLIAIPLLILDFLCIHPFKDGNGRVGRLLTLLLLYQSGFKVGKYISLERVIEESKETYYEALYDSSQKWHEGRHDILPWLRYFYGVMTAAYKEFEARVGVFNTARTKSQRIIARIEQSTQPFSVSDLKAHCPDTGIDLIRKILKDLQKAGRVKPLGKGRYAKWTLIR